MTIHVEASADVDDAVFIEDGARIWHHAQVRKGAHIGKNVIIGKGAYVGTNVYVGDNSKIQNGAMIYEPAKIYNGVFVGPGVIFTNDHYPRAINADRTQKSASDWQPVGVEVEEGASIGAGAICVAPVKIGRWAVVAAGAVVTKDVPPFSLVMGVPARVVATVNHEGKVEYWHE
jgi:UDP-2-acetamido-3-amino-2,3-dideoxy-glucuronate N-acetyltransferase